MLEPKADSTLFVAHRPDLLKRPVPPMAVPSFLDAGFGGFPVEDDTLDDALQH
ncbi:hypothetical protein ACFLIM_45120 [Nonomuraea sp. M3C6]|uniref:Uncharacterized protein n=1 Tax=Nonomuraea marmarensis TaxID=3351344 RepID=A0ABW7ASH3_9ACTN